MLNVKKLFTNILTSISTINGKLTVAEFTCTRTSAASSGSAKGVYDKAAGTVRIWGQWANSANVASGTALFTIPSDYRPSASQQGYGLLRTSGDVPLPSNYNATATGNITQTGSSQARGGFFYIEYVL